MSQVPLDSILNFRDVATTVNALTNSKSLKEGFIYRSARPDTATLKDRDLLKSRFQIKTVIDLRSDTEHNNATKKHSNAAAIPPAVSGPQSTIMSSTPLQIPDINYKCISLNGSSFERSLISHLSWSSLTKLLGLMAIGRREDAIAILGREVMTPRGLTGLGCDTLDHSQREIKQVFEILADESAAPVLVHCTQGKDRTGLIVALALLLCGVKQEAVRSDYVMSEKELEPEREERLVEIRRMGMDESFVACPEDFVEKIVAHLHKKYGSVEMYLEKIGVGLETQRKLKEMFTQDKSKTTDV